MTDTLGVGSNIDDFELMDLPQEVILPIYSLPARFAQDAEVTEKKTNIQL